MRQIPHKLRSVLSSKDEYGKCAREVEGACSGRITWEHAIIYAGKQVQEEWAIIPLCWYHHLGQGLDKRWNILYAMERATQKDKERYPLLRWKHTEEDDIL